MHSTKFCDGNVQHMGLEISFAKLIKGVGVLQIWSLLRLVSHGKVPEQADKIFSALRGFGRA